MASDISRRAMLKALGSSALLSVTNLAIPQSAQARALNVNQSERERRGRELRQLAADLTYRDGDVRHTNNREERDYPYIGNFGKALRHNELGETNKSDYEVLIKALETGNFELLNNIQIGFARLVDPPSALSFNLSGPDPFQLTVKPAPRIDHPKGAADLGLVYWMALCRDVHFSDYGSDTTVDAALTDLNQFSALLGPKVNGQVTADTLFRGFTHGDLTGPYVSQFLL